MHETNASWHHLFHAASLQVKSILYKNEDIDFPTGDSIGPIAKKMFDTLIGIQYGRQDHPWSILV